MSVASLVQRYNGTSWPRDKLGSCLHLECEYFKHNPQFKPSFSNWSFNPCQYTVSSACSLHLLRPKCPSCIKSTMVSCFLAEMTILVPFKIKLFPIVSSSLKSSMAIKLEVFVWLSLATLRIILCFIKAISSSACDDNCSWFKLSLLADSWLVIWYKGSLGNLIVSFWPPNLDKQLASWFWHQEYNKQWSGMGNSHYDSLQSWSCLIEAFG